MVVVLGALFFTLKAVSGMAHTRRERFSAHCACGDSLDIRSAYPDTLDFYRNMWEKLHHQPECAPVSAETASRTGSRKVAERLAC